MNKGSSGPHLSNKPVTNDRSFSVLFLSVVRFGDFRSTTSARLRPPFGAWRIRIVAVVIFHPDARSGDNDPSVRSRKS